MDNAGMDKVIKNKMKKIKISCENKKNIFLPFILIQ